MFSKLSIFFLIFFYKVNASIIMLLFWGYPIQDTTYCESSPSGSFENCINLCLSSDICMDDRIFQLSYGNDTTCMLCDIFTITSINQTDSNNGIKLAIKVDQRTQCPDEVQRNQYTKTGDNENSYKLSFDDPIWTVTYPKSCPDATWRMFPRSSGPYCIKVAGNNSGVTRNMGLSYCKAVTGSWLSGIVSQAEYDYVMSKGKSFYTPLSGYDYQTVWINGLMRPDCQPTQKPDCSGIGAFTEFNGETNMDYYKFPSGYPNFTMRSSSSLYLRCLQLMIGQLKTAWDGMVTNSACEYPCDEGKKVCAFAYACGVTAS